MTCRPQRAFSAAALAPRAVPQNRCAIIEWALASVDWSAREQKALIALWFEDGSCAKTAEVLGWIGAAELEKLYGRARVALAHADRRQEYIDIQQRKHREPGEHRISTLRIASESIWFAMDLESEDAT